MAKNLPSKKRCMKAVRRMNAAFAANNYNRMVRSLSLQAQRDWDIFQQLLGRGMLYLDYDNAFGLMPDKAHPRMWENCRPTDKDFAHALKNNGGEAAGCTPTPEEIELWKGFTIGCDGAQVAVVQIRKWFARQLDDRFPETDFSILFELFDKDWPTDTDVLKEEFIREEVQQAAQATAESFLERLRKILDYAVNVGDGRTANVIRGMFPELKTK